MRSLAVRLAVGTILVAALALGGCAGSGAGPSGTAGTGGSASGASGGAGAAGTTSATGGTGGTTSPNGGRGGTTSSAGGNGGSGGAGGGTGGTATGGTGGTPTGGTGGTPTGGTGGTVVIVRPTGRSAGCGMAPPAQDKSTGLTLHALAVPACTGAVTSKCVAPKFAPGGALAQTNGAYDFTKRNYAVQLPTNYNVDTAYPVIIAGGGCGGGPTESGGGATAGQGPADAIHIGMSYVKMCFADGGNSCAGTAANQPECVNTPEVPYFYALLAEIESKYCIDKSKVYVGGYSSGGWETYTLGCAAADVIRGITPVNGGLRNHKPACTGPMAALMVAGAVDTDNPVGPLVMDTAYAPANLAVADVNADISSLDSNGSAPARDALLTRNGCIGNATAVYDPAYPLCQKYTGCPEATPVVWCSVTGAGHQNLMYQGVTYYPSTGAKSLQWSFLTKLP
ncbi:MAG: hypothetical protein JWM82_4247 [Myxococcales bacterium]|nr:hypothetical protein [Myxococcales bacterium]